MKKTFKRTCLILLTAINISMVAVGCSSKGSTVNVGNLEKDIKNVSYRFDYDNKRDILLGSKRFIPIGMENIVVYDYYSATSMETDALTISKDGYIVGNSMVEWASKPHFYKKDKSIIQYIGEDNQAIEALNKVLGSQFAGQ